jgi:hypothetical protein
MVPSGPGGIAPALARLARIGGPPPRRSTLPAQGGVAAPGGPWAS